MHACTFHVYSVNVLTNLSKDLVTILLQLYGRSFPLLCVAGIPTAPMITTPPMEQNVPYDGRAVFECIATGIPAPTYEWFKNGETISGQNSPTLTLPNVQASNRGLYSCAVTNSEGSEESQPVYLRITGQLSLTQSFLCNSLLHKYHVLTCYRIIGNDTFQGRLKLPACMHTLETTVSKFGYYFLTDIIQYFSRVEETNDPNKRQTLEELLETVSYDSFWHQLVFLTPKTTYEFSYIIMSSSHQVINELIGQDITGEDGEVATIVEAYL